MSAAKSKKEELEFNKNEDKMKLKIAELNRHLAKIAEGGGKKRVEKLHAKGKMTARERIDYLIDDPNDFFEVGAFAGMGMYEEYGGCPAGGVVCGVGKIAGRRAMIVANDATVKAGAWFPITGKKNLRAQEIAMENRLPIIYLVDSAGVFLPMQDEIFPDKEHFGRIFRNNAIMSSEGIIQIAAVMGSCVAGGAYLPIMSDESLIVDKTGTIFLAGSYLVKAAIGETIDNETLGGATTHTEVSGVCDVKALNDKDCLDRIKKMMDKIGSFEEAGFNRSKPEKPKFKAEEILGIIPEQSVKPYDVRDVIARMVDKSEFEEYKEEFEATATTDKVSVFQSESYIMVFQSEGSQLILCDRKVNENRIELISAEYVVYISKCGIIGIERTLQLLEMIVSANLCSIEKKTVPSLTELLLSPFKNPMIS